MGRHVVGTRGSVEGPLRDLLITRPGHALRERTTVALILGISHLSLGALVFVAAEIPNSILGALIRALVLVACMAGVLLYLHSTVQASRPKQLCQLIKNYSELPDPKSDHLPAVYFLYVLGSGGHTGEMMQMLRSQFRANSNQHRRYLITSGDTHSINEVARFETLALTAFPDAQAGTFDIFEVARARYVHQSYLTSPFTTLWSALEVISALTGPPGNRKDGNLFRHPHVVVTNGPGTGFIVAVVAHVLKMLFMAPLDRIKVVYIETWAHVETLSLTGKLFHWTGLADLFCVQHEPLAKKYGKPNIRYLPLGATTLRPRGSGSSAEDGGRPRVVEE